jgi:hypothetical protein
MSLRPLTGPELDVVMSAAAPLALQDHAEFLEAVAGAMQGCAVVGVGLLHRICAEQQRKFLVPVDTARGRRAQPLRKIKAERGDEGTAI